MIKKKTILPKKPILGSNANIGSVDLLPLDTINGYPVRPGFYGMNGATVVNDGVNFTVHSHNAYSCELLLFHKRAQEPYAILKFPEHYKIGDVYSMIVFDIQIDNLEYAYRVDGPYEPKRGLIFDKRKLLLDPYAKAVSGQGIWGVRLNDLPYRARVVNNNFDWGTSPQPLIPMNELIIYEMHVRGFTRHESSGVKNPGTFEGLREKIPYLKELGVNAVELMPIFEFDEMSDEREHDGKQLLDYWGYNSISFFAPNTAYASKTEYNMEGEELKNLVRTLHENGMEVILDVVFNHTAEGNEKGRYISFKGFDNNIYYILTPNGEYYNFSGCGNTLNCNHPIVQQMILKCLRYWVIEYRVDGFRFDLASILGRNEDGSPMNNPPLLQSLAFDPILGNAKLIAEAWDAGGMYQVGSFPAWGRWAEWNGRYRDELRGYLKGDSGLSHAAAMRITGSQDLYDPEHRGENASVNFLTCHDGFPLHDLYAYNGKHNEANGWNGTDGSDDNKSWNCGEEGESTNPEVLRLRRRLVRNACAVLLCSRGTPMFLAGDEFGNTQFGNNNPYCQDNEISWLDWSYLEKNHDLFVFFQYMIDFRKQHSVIGKRMAPAECGFPDISFHGTRAWEQNFADGMPLGVMFAGRNKLDSKDDIVFLAVNAYWEDRGMLLPELPEGKAWRIEVNTAEELVVSGKQRWAAKGQVVLPPRTVIILTAKKK